MLSDLIHIFVNARAKFQANRSSGPRENSVNSENFSKAYPINRVKLAEGLVLKTRFIARPIEAAEAIVNDACSYWFY